jgi:hypothetical protein
MVTATNGRICGAKNVSSLRLDHSAIEGVMSGMREILPRGPAVGPQTVVPSSRCGCGSRVPLHRCHATSEIFSTPVALRSQSPRPVPAKDAGTRTGQPLKRHERGYWLSWCSCCSCSSRSSTFHRPLQRSLSLPHSPEPQPRNCEPSIQLPSGYSNIRSRPFGPRA